MTTDRLAWTVEQLDLRPEHVVLEIGFGHGVAASLVLARIETGRYIGVDRSAAMVHAATRRTQADVDVGRAAYVAASLLEAPLADRTFDRAFAARVRSMSEPDELRRVARALRPGGLLVLAFDSPDESHTRALVERAIANLGATGYDALPSTEAEIDGTTVVCVRGIAL